MFKKIVIIGLGLMGGSLAAACRKKFPGARIVGVTRNKKALSLAFRKKWIHEGADDVFSGARGADVVIICTPVDVYLPLLKKLDRVVSEHALVTDTGSVKGDIHDLVNAREWERISFVGAHPMVGSHERGIAAACPELYKKGTVILTRDKKTCLGSFRDAKFFWSKLAKKIVTLDPHSHDRLIGEISHLPHAISVCLMQAVSDGSLPLAATGFRDTTRVAASDTSIWLPIFKANRRQTLSCIDGFMQELKRFKKFLCSSDSRLLERYLEQAAKKRQAL